MPRGRLSWVEVMVQRCLQLRVGEHDAMYLWEEGTGVFGREHCEAFYFNLFPENVIFFFFFLLLPLIVSQEVLSEENMPFPESLSFSLPTCAMGT